MRASIASRIVLLGLLVGLAACQSGIPSVGALSASSDAGNSGSPAARAASAAHLYVATVANRVLAIERHQLRKGIPAVNPDRVYHGSSGLIAVSGNGTLYATLAQSPIVVDVFSPGHSRQVRKIHIKPRCGFSSSGFNVVNAIAADASGYLFVLIYSYPGDPVSREPRRAVPPPDKRTPCNGIAIYAPNARGRAEPVQTIKFSDAAELDGLAVDANDNLYVSGNQVVNEYSNAIANPTLTRTFGGKYIGTVRAIATDSAGDIFIANAQQSYSVGWIDRYSPSASGGGAPTSTIDLQGSGPHSLWSIAVYGRYLYVDDTGTSVDVYHALKNGEQSPIDSLPEQKKVDTIAAGP